jgi:hypothetical protein
LKTSVFCRAAAQARLIPHNANRKNRESLVLDRILWYPMIAAQNEIKKSSEE